MVPFALKRVAVYGFNSSNYYACHSFSQKIRAGKTHCQDASKDPRQKIFWFPRVGEKQKRAMNKRLVFWRPSLIRFFS